MLLLSLIVWGNDFAAIDLPERVSCEKYARELLRTVAWEDCWRLWWRVVLAMSLGFYTHVVSFLPLILSPFSVTQQPNRPKSAVYTRESQNSRATLVRLLSVKIEKFSRRWAACLWSRRAGDQEINEARGCGKNRTIRFYSKVASVHSREKFGSSNTCMKWSFHSCDLQAAKGRQCKRVQQPVQQ